MTHGNHPPATPLPRRTFLAQASAGLAAGVAAAAGASLPATAAPTAALPVPGAPPFLPDGPRIQISI
ncbi:polysaccharide deacetylase, partial [Burkholderia cenocepacia]|nr:polysaccharide deacetylase [Burkholderia cenocepacia]